MQVEHDERTLACQQRRHSQDALNVQLAVDLDHRPVSGSVDANMHQR